MAIDVTSNALLSPRAKDLRGDAESPSAAFLDLVNDAEGILEFTGQTFSGAALSMARTALVLMVNHLIELDPAGNVLQSEGASTIRRSYRERVSVVPTEIRSLLVEIKRQAGPGRYTVVTSLQ